MKRLVTKLISDERDGEALEYALVTGLVTVLSISAVGAVGRMIQVLCIGIDAAL